MTERDRPLTPVSLKSTHTQDRPSPDMAARSTSHAAKTNLAENLRQCVSADRVNGHNAGLWETDTTTRPRAACILLCSAHSASKQCAKSLTAAAIGGNVEFDTDNWL